MLFYCFWWCSVTSKLAFVVLFSGFSSAFPSHCSLSPVTNSLCQSPFNYSSILHQIIRWVWGHSEMRNYSGYLSSSVCSIEIDWSRSCIAPLKLSFRMKLEAIPTAESSQTTWEDGKNAGSILKTLCWTKDYPFVFLFFWEWTKRAWNFAHPRQSLSYFYLVCIATAECRLNQNLNTHQPPSVTWALSTGTKHLTWVLSSTIRFMHISMHFTSKISIVLE
jgi:hypothetical protein